MDLLNWVTKSKSNDSENNQENNCFKSSLNCWEIIYDAITIFCKDAGLNTQSQ